MKNIILIGFMGSGKTTVGKILEEKTGLRFLDTDAEIECTAGMRVRQIFETYGEAHFRKLETETLRRLLETSGSIISTGGGAVTTPENREIMRRGGWVVFLEVPLFAIAARLENDETRPLLNTPEKQKSMETLYAARLPAYRAFAHFTVQGEDSAALADQILKQIKE